MTDAVRSRAESSEKTASRVGVASSPAGLDSARSEAYGPQSYGGLQYQQPAYDTSVPSNTKQPLQGHVSFIDCSLGDVFANTFNTALDKEEDAMIAAPLVGTIFGVGDAFRAARDAAATFNQTAQDLYGTYTSEDSAKYSQKLYQDVDKIAQGFEFISAAANHAWDVAAQHDNGVTNAGYANPETYKQIATDTASFAGAVGDALSKLRPSEQILGAERLAAAALFTHHLNWATNRVGGALKEIDLNAVINKVQLPELSIVESATEGPGIGNVLLVSKLKQPNAEGFAIGRAAVGEKLVNGETAVLASTIENALKPEQYEAILQRSLAAKRIAPEDGQEIAAALKDRLKENFPLIQNQNLAFAIVYKDGKPSIIYSFNGIDFPGPKADPNHFPWYPLNSRYTDSEHRLLVELDKQLANGLIDKNEPMLLYTQQKPCKENCGPTIALFERKNHMKIEVSHSFEDWQQRKAAGH